MRYVDDDPNSFAGESLTPAPARRSLERPYLSVVGRSQVRVLRTMLVLELAPAANRDAAYYTTVASLAALISGGLAIDDRLGLQLGR